MAALSALVSFAAAVPLLDHVVHERRSSGSRWLRTDFKPAAENILPISIGLKQRNLEHGHELLMDVSHPSSANYGKHMTTKQVSYYSLGFSMSLFSIFSKDVSHRIVVQERQTLTGV